MNASSELSTPLLAWTALSATVRPVSSTNISGPQASRAKPLAVPAIHIFQWDPPSKIYVPQKYSDHSIWPNSRSDIIPAPEREQYSQNNMNCQENLISNLRKMSIAWKQRENMPSFPKVNKARDSERPRHPIEDRYIVMQRKCFCPAVLEYINYIFNAVNKCVNQIRPSDSFIPNMKFRNPTRQPDEDIILSRKSDEKRNLSESQNPRAVGNVKCQLDLS